MGEVDKMVNISSIQGMQRRKMIFISVMSYHLHTICINYHEKNSVGLLQSLVNTLIKKNCTSISVLCNLRRPRS